MAHFPGPKLAVDFGRYRDSKRIGNSLRNFAHAHGFAAADIDRQTIECVRFRSQEIGPRNILHE